MDANEPIAAIEARKKLNKYVIEPSQPGKASPGRTPSTPPNHKTTGI